MSNTVHNAQIAEAAPVAAQGGDGQQQAISATAGAGNDYVSALENAVLDAEWWMAHPQVAARKDPRGERKRAVYKAADAVRERRWQTEAVPATATPSLLASLVAIKDLLEDGTEGNKPRRLRDACRASNRSDQRHDHPSQGIIGALTNKKRASETRGP